MEDIIIANLTDLWGEYTQCEASWNAELMMATIIIKSLVTFYAFIIMIIKLPIEAI